ncbi:unnamed protein product [Soboliphyme baturini]|uniref:tRNA-dihydrouridine(16/17) synthase [NAD(P)(+)] n=1 Tax=Soboliphyme baturini TaxID=241478 RepID=A0A183IB31_9BILA|nr:unnamed protein product [Soboliphyme baturini]
MPFEGAQKFEFYKCIGSPKLVVAPMVDQSELAWRILCRRHGADLCYTPMLHAQNFATDRKYRANNFHFEKRQDDRPLIGQFCANDPGVLLSACELVLPHCDGIDLNLGCPQTVARHGHYGAYLQDEWELIHSMIRTLRMNLNVAVSCKVRIFDDVSRSIDYAKMLESSGCQLLAVHGRTREQKGINTGVASWSHIRFIKESVNIPVIANGNIQFYSDIDRCFQETGADAVMTAEGNLHNPYLFDNVQPPVWEPLFEYLDIVQDVPTPVSFVRGHLFKVLHHLLFCPDVREQLAVAENLEQFRHVVDEVRNRFVCMRLSMIDRSLQLLPFPHWICQPYVRPSSYNLVAESEQLEQMRRNFRISQHEKIRELASECGLSRKQVKKLGRNPHAKLRQFSEISDCRCGNTKVSFLKEKRNENL